jgi:WD40 repeat protein
MASKPRAKYLYTETRLNLDPAYPSAALTLQLPTSSSSWNPLSAISNPLSHNPSKAVIYDEATFSKKYLAGDGSIFFRRETRSPRSFLWRLLDNRKLLELQAVDLTQAASEKTEALLTIQLAFPSAIRPYGIAFGDPDDRDALAIFALTMQGELYTINLHRDLFVHSKAAESLPPDWCKTFNPPALRIREPYRLFVPSVNQLLLSLSDGCILQLDRSTDNDAPQWTETYFTAAGWSLSLPRSIAKWRGESFVRFGDTELASSTAASVLLSPDEENIITVCLNNTLKIWNVSTGKVTLEADLTETDPDSTPNKSSFLLAANQRQLLQVLDTPGREGDKYYIVTFSPKNHQFSFWAVLDADSGFDGVRRVQSDFEFTPPIEDLMDTSSWNLEEFYVRANRGWSETQLWLRARAGPVSRVFKVDFSLFDDDESLDEAWKTKWTAISAGRQSAEYLNQAAPPQAQPEDAALHCPNSTDKWLDFLFYPGRFSIPTLETALYVYSKGSKSTQNEANSKGGRSLKEKLSDAVATKAFALASNSGHDIQEIQTSEQWHIFFGLVQELHKRRSTTLSFAMDSEDRLPWIVSADLVSAVRTCTDLDICDFHRSPERNVPTEDLIAKNLESTYEVLDLLHVAHVFRSSLSPTFQDQFSRVVLSELLEDPSSSVRDRMLAVHEDADLAVGVSQEDWDRFNNLLEEAGGFDVLDYTSFMSILDQLDQPSEGKGHGEQITRYGARTLIRTAQETLALNTKTLLDLLLLTVFVEVEVEDEELQQSMQSTWRGQDIYVELLSKLKEHAVLDFLMRNIRTELPKKPRRSSIGESPSALRTSQAAVSEITYTSTLMESLFIGDWATLHYPMDSELPELITFWARRWISSQGLSTQYDNFSEHVFADLIKNSGDQLCLEFLPYVPDTTWGVYLKGRLHLLHGKFSMAASCFRKAAFGLCKSIS